MNESCGSAPVAPPTRAFFHPLLQSLNRDLCWGEVKRKGRVTKTMRLKLTPEGSARVCEGKLQSRKGKAHTKLEGS